MKNALGIFYSESKLILTTSSNNNSNINKDSYHHIIMYIDSPWCIEVLKKKNNIHSFFITKPKQKETK